MIEHNHSTLQCVVVTPERVFLNEAAGGRAAIAEVVRRNKVAAAAGGGSVAASDIDLSRPPRFCAAAIG